MGNFNRGKPLVTKISDGIKFGVRVLPNASRCEIVGVTGNEIKIKLDVPPVEGKANEKCVRFLAKLLGVPKSAVNIISGEKSRSKVLTINGNPDELEEKFIEFLNNSNHEIRKTL